MERYQADGMEGSFIEPDISKVKPEQVNDIAIKTLLNILREDNPNQQQLKTIVETKSPKN